MKEALYYEKRDDNAVACKLCPRQCIILDGASGWCSARKNQGGKLYSLVYGMPASFNADPIEKKPLYHFLPGSEALSFGTVGCNMGCLHCQNHELSRTKPDDISVREFAPDEIVEMAVKSKCESIAYTYNEPTVFYEFALDVAKLAHQKGIRNVFVSNGYISHAPLAELVPYMDANNIDLKSFDPNFYQNQCNAKLEHVLDTLKFLKEKKVWLEITNLVIPTLNDNMDMIESMCKWIQENLGSATPIHFSRFFPDYKTMSLPRTPPETLLKAREIGKKYLDYVYVGNLLNTDFDNTICPICNTLVIERAAGIGILQNNLRLGAYCPNGHLIPGIFK